LDDLPNIAKSVSDKLALQIEEFELKTESEIKKLEKQVIISSSMGIVNVVLTLISAYYYPPLALVPIIGLPSVKDALNDVKKHDKFIEEIGGRPIGILANVHNRAPE